MQAVHPELFDHQELQSRIGFLEWVWRFQSTFLKEQLAYHTCLGKPFSKTVLFHNFLVMPRINDSKREPSWTDVLVVGEFCLDESDKHQAGPLQLCEYV